MVCIQDYSTYNSGMKKSYEDKLFFFDIINDFDSILDFGCASGDMIGYMHSKKPSVKLYGYDIDKHMIGIARRKYGEIAEFRSNFNEIVAKCNPRESAINLSSVIHEVYSYCDDAGVENFWNQVFNTGFKYVIIRDLCVSKSCKRETDISDYNKIVKTCDKEQLEEFTSMWGTLKDNKNMIHYLMKYRYIENWKREVIEDYFPIYFEDLISKIPSNQYKIVYKENYILPFTKDKIKNDFDICINDNTHIKLVLKCK